MTVYDIAGLTRGSSTGAGLGNAFLSHIRAVDAIFQVVRCFDDAEIIHIEGDVNPTRDLDIISEELRLKDIEFVEKALEKAENIPGTSGKHPIAAAVGTVLTGGVEMAGTKGYLAVSPLPSLSVSWGPDAMRLFRDGANGGDAM